jgi:hypothetical protein
MNLKVPRWNNKKIEPAQAGEPIPIEESNSASTKGSN